MFWGIRFVYNCLWYDLLIAVVDEQRVNWADLARLDEAAGVDAVIDLVFEVDNGILPNGEDLGGQVHAVAGANAQAAVDVDLQPVDGLFSDV